MWKKLNLFRVTIAGASDESVRFSHIKYNRCFRVEPFRMDLRFQDRIQNMATGFGIAADKATVMSKESNTVRL